MIGGTSGSEAKRCQPSMSQSKITQTRSSSLGSRKTVAPLDPCCRRFSAPLVEKMDSKRSKSSTVVVARSILLLLYESRRRGSAADPGLLVDVLEVGPDGLDRDAEILGDRFVGLAAHEHEQDFELALG